MKHSILIEFHTSKPLPDDFLDKVADRVYRLDELYKGMEKGKEMIVSLLTQDQVDLLKENKDD